jgi:hypothetical protein
VHNHPRSTQQQQAVSKQQAPSGKQQVAISKRQVAISKQQQYTGRLHSDTLTYNVQTYNTKKSPISRTAAHALSNARLPFTTLVINDHVMTCTSTSHYNQCARRGPLQAARCHPQVLGAGVR